MAERPILMLGEPALAERDNLHGGGKTFDRPSRKHQNRYFADLRKIRDAIARVEPSPLFGEVERIIVLEVAVGSADGLKKLAQAADEVEGLEWLLEVDLEPDVVEGFNHGVVVDRRLFAFFTNREAMDKLIGFWDVFQSGADAPRGLGPFFDVFRHLTDVRLWDEKDRLFETGLASWWEERLESGDDPIFFQAEFWYSDDATRGARSLASLQQTLAAVSATVAHVSRIPGIRYHAACISCPRAGIEAALAALKNDVYVQMLRCDEVMFFRGGGQSSIKAPVLTGVTPTAPEVDRPLPSGEPLVALLDGLPLANHADLRGRVRIDDPDDFASFYPAGSRRHGTAMASQIVHGDLTLGEASLRRPILARPVMHPAGSNDAAETWPANRLFVDLFHEAVRGIVVGTHDQPAAGPSVRIVNVSLGNEYHRFVREMSPLARLIDWLSAEHNLLFLVSAGNILSEIQLNVGMAEFEALDPADARARVLEQVQRDRPARRLLSPAEAVNAVTVGALHADGATAPKFAESVGNRDVLEGKPFPSLLNPVGSGRARAVKPEILMPGGRQYYQRKAGTRVIFKINDADKLPGQLVAAPSPTPGTPRHRVHMRGTSNAAANATRLASRIYETLEALRDETDSPALADDRLTVLTKALLVHGAGWGEETAELDAHCGPNDQETWRNFRQNKAAVLGFGPVDPERSRVSTDQRVLMLGTGRLRNGKADEYRVPIPSGLGGKRLRRRIVLTLAWLSPLNPRHRGYTRASLYLTKESTVAGFLASPRDADERLSRRGSVQHLVFEESTVVAVDPDAVMTLKVNCRESAGGLLSDVPYGLAVTVEAADPQAAAIHEEMRDRLAALAEGARVRA